jgi:hypothetical protein
MMADGTSASSHDHFDLFEGYAAFLDATLVPDDGNPDEIATCFCDRQFDADEWIAKVRKQREDASAKAASPTTIDFVKALFAGTDGETYVCSFPNERDDPNQSSERHVIGRKSAAIEAFIKKWDKPGRGAFICVGTLKKGADRRAKENIEQTNALHGDIDFKDVDSLGEEPTKFVLRQLARLKYPPSIIVLSGGGVHCYWLLKEPLDTQAPVRSNLLRLQSTRLRRVVFSAHSHASACRAFRHC